MSRRAWRVAAAIFGTLGVVVLPSSPVAADPAGPTDYLSEIQSITPETTSIEVQVLGGDSFIQLEVEAGTDVVVLGYRSEQYLWFQSDGTVLENQNAPSTYTNDDRFGNELPPANATPDAEPDWEQVADGGRYSWHDHRAHWMQSTRPAGKQAGDQIVEGVIPLVVDGAEVDVTVISTWQPEPSSAPIWVGALLGVGLVGLAFWLWRVGRHWAVAVSPLPIVALVAGVMQFTSLPSETGPRLVWWALPFIALVAVIIAVAAEARGRSFVARAAGLVAGVQLLMWGLIKRDGLNAALIPTDAPGWFDRLATSSALVGGIALSAFALWMLFGARQNVSVSTAQPG